jgi:hypothetical protein
VTIAVRLRLAAIGAFALVGCAVVAPRALAETRVWYSDIVPGGVGVKSVDVATGRIDDWGWSDLGVGGAHLARGGDIVYSPAVILGGCDPAVRAARDGSVRRRIPGTGCGTILSPDETSALFTDATGIVRLDRGAAAPDTLITRAETGPSPGAVWSPDGARAAYGSFGQAAADLSVTGDGLWTMSRTGGARARVTAMACVAAPDGPSVPSSPADLDWGRSGLIAFVDETCSDAGGTVLERLSVVSPDGSGLRTPFACAFACHIREPRVSPDGSATAIDLDMLDAAGAEHEGLYAVPTGGGAPRLLVDTDPNPIRGDIHPIGWETCIGPCARPGDRTGAGGPGTGGGTASRGLVVVSTTLASRTPPSWRVVLRLPHPGALSVTLTQGRLHAKARVTRRSKVRPGGSSTATVAACATGPGAWRLRARLARRGTRPARTLTVTLRPVGTPSPAAARGLCRPRPSGAPPSRTARPWRWWASTRSSTSQVGVDPRLLRSGNW